MRSWALLLAVLLAASLALCAHAPSLAGLHTIIAPEMAESCARILVSAALLLEAWAIWGHAINDADHHDHGDKSDAHKEEEPEMRRAYSERRAHKIVAGAFVASAVFGLVSVTLAVVPGANHQVA